MHTLPGALRFPGAPGFGTVAVMNAFTDPTAPTPSAWVFEHPDFSASAETLARGWLHDFEASIRQPERLNALLDPDPHWRDLLAFTWSIRSFSGNEAILAALGAAVGRIHPRAFRIARGRTPPRFVTRAGRTVLECMFDFETDQGQASGVLRAIPGTRTRRSEPGCC